MKLKPLFLTSFYQNRSVSELKNIRKKFSDEDLKEIDALLEKLYGEVPFIYQKLPKEYKGSFFLKNDALFRSPNSKLSPKEKELITLAAATALQCTHCQEVHIKSALDLGITLDEIKETILLSSAIAESSTLAIALRSLDKIEKSDE